MSDRIHKGSLSPRRYVVREELPDNPRERFMKGIAAHAFLAIDPKGGETTSAGWVSALDEDNVAPGLGDVFFNGPGGERMVVTLRIDTLKPPAVEVKRRVKARVATMEAEEGRKLSRREKRLIKEEVARDLRLHTIPKVKLVDAIWMLDEGRLWLLSQSKGDNALFVDLFTKSFGLKLDEENVVEWSRLACSPAALARLEPTRELWLGFPGVRPGVSAPVEDEPSAQPPRDEEESGETPTQRADAEQRDDLTFLAREFLTWLVFHAEAGAGEFTGIELDSPFAIGCAGKMALRSPAGLVTDMAIKGPSPVTSGDLRYALAGGLAVKEVDLFLTKGDRQWTFALAADRFDLKRVKLPELLTEDADDRAGERVDLLGKLDEAVNLAFAEFMGYRVKPAWSEDVVPAIRQWLIEGIGSSTDAAEGEVA